MLSYEDDKVHPKELFECSTGFFVVPKENSFGFKPETLFFRVEHHIPILGIRTYMMDTSDGSMSEVVSALKVKVVPCTVLSIDIKIREG